MPAVKPIADIVDKWERRASVAGADYAKGVASPKRDWEEATKAATAAQKAGVEQALADGRFEKGVARAGTSKWKRKSQEVGAARFGPGVKAAKADYQAGFTPFISVIEGITLPPRGPKGDPRNYERSQIIGEALHDAKVSGV